MSYVTIYTVRRSPCTGGARLAAPLPVDFEYIAENPGNAIQRAINDCEFNRPAENFTWKATGSRVVGTDQGEQG